jgi:hypothetical protein
MKLFAMSSPNSMKAIYNVNPNRKFPDPDTINKRKLKRLTLEGLVSLFERYNNVLIELTKNG